MKKLIILLFVALIAVPAFSQLNFGIKAGVNTNSITMSDLKTLTSGSTTYTVDKLKGANYGFHGGIFLRLKVWKIFLQPEALFSTRTNEYTVTNGTTSVASIVKQNFNKLDIPVMVGLKFGPVRLNAGPVGSILINSPKDLISDPDFKGMYNTMTVGYQAGLGLDILKKLTIDLRYEGSLAKYQNQIENATGTKFNLDDRPNAFLLSVGLMF
jgi:hypothetical protein